MVTFSQIIENPNGIGPEKVELSSIIPYLVYGNHFFDKDSRNQDGDRVKYNLWVSLGTDMMYSFIATLLVGQSLKTYNIIEIEYAPQNYLV